MFWFKNKKSKIPSNDAEKAAQAQANRIRAALSQIDREPVLTSRQIHNMAAAAMVAKCRQLDQRRRPMSRVGRILRPGLSFGFSAASAACVAMGFYLIFGGNNGPIVAQATTEAPFVLREQRSALGLNWYEEKQIEAGANVVFHEGDMIYATQPVTLSYSNSDASVIQSQSEVVVLSRNLGLEVRFGRIDHVVVEKNEHSNAISVIERRAQYPSKFGGDNQSPNLLVEDPAKVNGNANFAGQTEPGAILMINNTAVKLDSEGKFNMSTRLPVDRRVRLISRDFAGNETRLTQILE